LEDYNGNLKHEEKIDEALEATILSDGRSAEIFLHGYCDVFALALHQAFGYEMEQMADSAEPDTLVHAYCISHNAAGNKVFIDVRGITSSEGVSAADIKKAASGSQKDY